MALSRESILKHAGVFKTKTIHVPAWADDKGDDTVIVRGMTVREFEVNQARIVRAAGDSDDAGRSTSALVCRCVVDGTGGRVFTDADIDTVAELGFAEVNRIGEAIGELSGMGVSTEDVEKNLPAVQSGNSPTESPVTSEE